MVFTTTAEIVRGCQKRSSPSSTSAWKRKRSAAARERANAGRSASHVSSATQTGAKSVVSNQSTQRVVLPYPAGAAMSVPFTPTAISSRALSRGRRTTSGRRRGTANFDVATPSMLRGLRSPPITWGIIGQQAMPLAHWSVCDGASSAHVTARNPRRPGNGQHVFHGQLDVDATRAGADVDPIQRACRLVEVDLEPSWLLQPEGGNAANLHAGQFFGLALFGHAELLFADASGQRLQVDLRLHLHHHKQRLPARIGLAQ